MFSIQLWLWTGTLACMDSECLKIDNSKANFSRNSLRIKTLKKLVDITCMIDMWKTEIKSGMGLFHVNFLLQYTESFALDLRFGTLPSSIFSSTWCRCVEWNYSRIWHAFWWRSWKIFWIYHQWIWWIYRSPLKLCPEWGCSMLNFFL